MRTQEDMRFVTLLRHAHVLPFAPLPHARRDADLTDKDTLYAVFQPVDHISRTSLSDISVAHADRAKHRAAAAMEAACMPGDQDVPGHPEQPPPQAGQAGPSLARQGSVMSRQGSVADDGGADAQLAKRPRVGEDASAGPPAPEAGVPAAAQAPPAQPGGAPPGGSGGHFVPFMVRDSW